MGGPRNAGGYGPINGQWYGGDTGGYWPQGRETQQVPSSPQEIQRAYEEAMRQLNALRQSFQGQPEPLADLQEVIKEMQRLDRFRRGRGKSFSRVETFIASRSVRAPDGANRRPATPQ